jgi:hypothetical protein
VIADSRLHRWRHSQGFVNPAEIVVHEMKRNRMLMVFDFLGECIRQSGKSAVAHSQSEILPLDIARADIRLVGIAGNSVRAGAKTFWWTISGFVWYLFRPVNFHKLRIVDIGTENSLDGPMAIRAAPQWL